MSLLYHIYILYISQQLWCILYQTCSCLCFTSFINNHISQMRPSKPWRWAKDEPPSLSDYLPFTTEEGPWEPKGCWGFAFPKVREKRTHWQMKIPNIWITAPKNIQFLKFWVWAAFCTSSPTRFKPQEVSFHASFLTADEDVCWRT